MNTPEVTCTHRFSVAGATYIDLYAEALAECERFWEGSNDAHRYVIDIDSTLNSVGAIVIAHRVKL